MVILPERMQSPVLIFFLYNTKALQAIFSAQNYFFKSKFGKKIKLQNSKTKDYGVIYLRILPTEIQLMIRNRTLDRSFHNIPENYLTYLNLCNKKKNSEIEIIKDFIEFKEGRFIYIDKKIEKFVVSDKNVEIDDEIFQIIAEYNILEKKIEIRLSDTIISKKTTSFTVNVPLNEKNIVGFAKKLLDKVKNFY